jgi:hypothetical protein
MDFPGCVHDCEHDDEMADDVDELDFEDEDVALDPDEPDPTQEGWQA